VKKLLMLLIMFSLVCVSFSPVFADEVKYKSEYRLACNLSELMPQGRAVTRFIQLVKEGTNGKVNIKPYWMGQLYAGKATNEMLIMRQNVGDFSASSLLNWAPQFPEVNLFLLPWFISEQPDVYKAVDAIEAGKAGKMLEAKVESMGLKVLGWGEQGVREVTNKIRPIRTPDDLKDLKIRVVGSPILLDIFNALGANPTSMAWSEVLLALQQGAIDGQENPYSIFIPNKTYEFQKYMTEWGYVVDPLFFTVHGGVWKSFPDDVKKVIMDAAQECGQYNKALARLGLDDGTAEKWLKEHNLYPKEMKDIDVNPRKFVRDQGVEVIVLTQEERIAFRKKMDPVYEKWIKVIGEDLVEAAKEDMKNAKY